MRYLCIIPLFLAVLISVSAETVSGPGERSLNDIFPGLQPAIRESIFSKEGYFRSYEKTQPSSLLGSGHSAIDPQIIQSVISKQPSILVESITVIPDTTGKYSLLDVYNSLRNISSLKGRLYHSRTRNREIPLFEEVTFIESERRNVPIPDPAPVSRIPNSETYYIRIKDVNFGNSFYRGDLSLIRHGLRYSMTNNRNLTYLFIPVIREEMFIVQMYFEQIAEGILIYSLAGANVSDLISSRVDMPSSISKRLAVIIAWVAEGITGN